MSLNLFLNAIRPSVTLSTKSKHVCWVSKERNPVQNKDRRRLEYVDVASPYLDQCSLISRGQASRRITSNGVIRGPHYRIQVQALRV